jgi:hypothetical protein
VFDQIRLVVYTHMVSYMIPKIARHLESAVTALTARILGHLNKLRHLHQVSYDFLI